MTNQYELCKLTEEMGEVGQILGKLLAFPTGDHPGDPRNLNLLLEEELGDLKAAIELVIEVRQLSEVEINQRTFKKIRLFREWVKNEHS